MIKKIFSIFIIFMLGQGVLAKEIPVQISSANKITTSDSKLKEGDNLNFVVSKDVFYKSKLILKKGETVIGVVTSIEDNDFMYKPATLYIENFRTNDVNNKNIKLSGAIYKIGRNHWMFTQFIPTYLWPIRGGEVQISTNDIFTLFFDETNSGVKRGDND